MKKSIFLGILIILTFPLADTIIGGFFHFEKLAGEYSKSTDISFTNNDYFSNQYQSQKSLFLNENLNLYPFFVKLNNQIKFSLFDQVSVKNAVVGKNNIIFDDSYIKSYYGQDFVGKDFASDRIKEMDFFNQILQLYNKKLIVCILPGKGYFYPESFPNNYQSNKKTLTNAEFYTSELQKINVPIINLIDYLTGISDTAKSPIYPKESIHPSAYGLTIAADTIVHFLDQTFNIQLPKIKHPFFTSTHPLFYEDDILRANNLLFPTNFHTTFSYPNLSFTKGRDKLKTLVVGDSFFKYLYKEGFQKNVLGDGDFWFYGETYWPSKKSIYEHNIRLDFFNHDMVMLFVSEATLYLFPYNLDTKILERILPFNDSLRLKFFEMKFAHNHKWSEAVKQKAKENNTPFEIQKKKDIDYMLYQSYQTLDSTDKELYGYIQQMKSNSNWFQSIKEKARTNSISLENALMKDAIYLFNQKHSEQ